MHISSLLIYDHRVRQTNHNLRPGVRPSSSSSVDCLDSLLDPERSSIVSCLDPLTVKGRAGKRRVILLHIVLRSLFGIVSISFTSSWSRRAKDMSEMMQS